MKTKLITLILSALAFLGFIACSVDKPKYAFTVEIIDKGDFEAAERSNLFYATEIYNDVTPNDVTDKILRGLQNREYPEVDRLVSIDEMNSTDEIGLTIDRIIYIEEMKMYGVILGEYTEAQLYCFDCESAKYLGRMFMPFAISQGGIAVGIPEKDCDFILDLHFYKRFDNIIIETFTYKDVRFGGESISDYYRAKSGIFGTPSFWCGESELYIAHNNFTHTETQYMKISFGECEMNK